MLTQLQYTVSNELLQESLSDLPKDKKLTINQPIGDFFYTAWKIKEEYKNTVWDKILSSLPETVGEARIIILEPGTCYQSHCDIDDRYHLNISGTNSYLINLDDEIMYPIKHDGHWYKMNGGIRHSAVNFGQTPRIQLVVRSLLTNSVLNNPVTIKITTNIIYAYKTIFTYT